MAGMLSQAAVVVVFFTLVLTLIHTGAEEDQTSAIDWNRPVDRWLKSKIRDIVQQNVREIPIDNIDENFSTRAFFINLRGRFIAREGTIRDLMTLRRRSKVIAERRNKVTRLTTRLGWDTLILKFGYYRLDMLWLKINGSLEGNIKLNAVEITLAFEEVNGECVTTLDRLKIVEFDDFDLKVTGLGPLNFAASSIVRIAAEKHKEKIIENTERKLKEFVNVNLNEYYCEEHASLFGVPL